MATRIDKIKKARSLKELWSTITEIASEINSSKRVVNKLVQSLSADIDINHNGNQPRPTPSGRPKIKVEWKAPKITDIKENSEVANKLQDNIDDLTNAIALVKQSFTGKKQAEAIKAMEALRNEAVDQLAKAYQVLSDTALRHMPTKARDMLDSVISEVIDLIPNKSYTGLSEDVYLVPNPEEKGSFLLCMYVSIRNIKNEAGFAYKEYHIVLTGVLSTSGEIEYFINAFPNFKSPGRYPLGKEVSSAKAAAQRIAILLAHHNFVLEHDRLPMPVDTKRVEHMGVTKIKGVVSAEVKNDELVVITAPGLGDRAKQNVIDSVLATLCAVIGYNTNKKIFTYKIGKVRGQDAVKFVLVPNVDKADKGMHINVTKLDEVANMLDLSDKQVAALRFALQH